MERDAAAAANFLFATNLADALVDAFAVGGGDLEKYLDYEVSNQIAPFDLSGAITASLIFRGRLRDFIANHQTLFSIFREEPLVETLYRQIRDDNRWRIIARRKSIALMRTEESIKGMELVLDVIETLRPIAARWLARNMQFDVFINRSVESAWANLRHEVVRPPAVELVVAAADDDWE